MSVQLYLGDCLEVMRGLDENSVDTCITDPPYELGFMGKRWDSSGVAFQPETWKAVYRVLKPGAILLAFGGTRTYHRMVCAIEDAGFEIRDTIAWVYGSGFPKSYDISKGIDKVNGETGRQLKFTRWFRSTGITRTEATKLMIDAGHITDNGTMAGHYFANSEAGQPAIPTRAIWTTLRPHCGNIPKWVDELVERVEAEREVVGSKSTNKTVYQRIGDNNISGDIDITAPSTPEAQLWDGWGTALKPSHEPIVLAMKPIDGNFVNNALTWGVAGLWIDGGRVEFVSEADKGDPKRFQKTDGGVFLASNPANTEVGKNGGRFPANLIHDGSDEVTGLFPMTTISRGGKTGGGVAFGKEHQVTSKDDPGYGDSGSAARFFYCAKSSRRERNNGLDCYVTVKYNIDKSILGGLSWKDVSTVAVQLLRRVISDTETVSFNIGEFGESITVQCHKDSLSIISMEISKIIESKILNSLMHLLTRESTVDVNYEMENGGNLAESAENLRKWLLTITKENLELARGVSSVVLTMLLKIRNEDEWKPASNFHATVKPLALMRYLVRLTKTPTGGVVLDPFMGSGSTGCACVLEGRDFIGIEREADYLEIAEKRIKEAQEQLKLELE